MVVISATLLPQIPTISRPSLSRCHHHHSFPTLTKNPNQNSTGQRNVVVFAEDNNNEQSKQIQNGDDDLKNNRRPIFKIGWRDLLDPDPQNVLAIGLTGLLTWASVQVLWQLFVISLAILVAALKYSFIAALLLFILVTLL